jgi:lipopolysaccharide export LptBFGC system permease protein LptF
MKRIDRYVLVAFLVRLFGVAGVVLFLYVTYDILTRIDHLRNAGFGRAMGMLLAYYGYLVPICCSSRPA